MFSELVGHCHEKILSVSDPHQLKLYLRYLFWHSTWHIFWHSIRHSIWHLFWHSIWHSMWDLALAIEVPQCPMRSVLAVDVQQCPLSSGARRWGPAAPTEIWSSPQLWSSRLRSGSAHWDHGARGWGPGLPLTSGARGWGPGVRTSSAHCDLELADLTLAVEDSQGPLGFGVAVGPGQCPLRSGARSGRCAGGEGGRGGMRSDKI